MKPDINIIFCLFLLLALSSCGCKDTFTPLNKEEKKWIPYKNGERVRYIINNKDTIEYFAEVIESRKKRNKGSYGGRDLCDEISENIKVVLKTPNTNIKPFSESVQYLEYEINSDNLSGIKYRSSLYIPSTNESHFPDSNVVINGITYPVYNFNYDTKYHYLQKSLSPKTWAICMSEIQLEILLLI